MIKVEKDKEYLYMGLLGTVNYIFDDNKVSFARYENGMLISEYKLSIEDLEDIP